MVAAISSVDQVELVTAAQRGDAGAREVLIAEHLPLLYNVVGRALNGHPDVDDVVQETLLCAVRDLSDLRAPESFRAWLLAIALRQVGTHQRRRRAIAERTTVLEAADQVPDGRALENETVLRLHLARERREVAEAVRWLDPGFRDILALWWQENAGLLSRREVAAAAQTSVAHVGVRVQRMREQLEQCRTIVAAMAADPRCPDLAALLAPWDGEHSPVWRKRITRHARECPQCGAVASGRVPIERLLSGIAPLAVPSALTAALHVRGLLAAAPTVARVGPSAARVGHVARSAGHHGRVFHKLIRPVAAHPVVGAAAAGACVAASAVVVAVLPGPAHRSVAPAATVSASVLPRPAPSVTADPDPAPARQSSTASAIPAGTVPLGTWSLESVYEPWEYLADTDGYAALASANAASSEQVRGAATFTVIRGLADSQCVTLIASDGLYLEQHELRLRLTTPLDTQDFRKDVTFCPSSGAVADSVTLHAYNYPDLVIRYVTDSMTLQSHIPANMVVHYDGGAFYIMYPDDTSAFAEESSFLVKAPWAS